MKIRKFLPTILAVCLLLTPAQVYPAGLDGALDAMWMSTGTTAGDIHTATRNGFQGGQFLMRWPTKTLNLVSVDPPRVDAGCGGIDLYGGSFSWINGQQFTQMLRQIGSAAVGYFFKMALQSMCSLCSSVLNTLEKVITDINQMSINTCKAGQALANVGMAGFHDLEGDAAKATNDIATAKGLVQDQITGWENLQTDAQTFWNTAKDYARNTALGNAMWKLLAAQDAAAAIDSRGSLADENMNEILMSLTGTYIVDASKCWGASSGSSCTPTESYIGPTITNLKEFIEGSNQANFNFLSCGGDYDQTGCINPTPTPSNWKGIHTYVLEMLFGKGATDTSQALPGGIIDNFRTNNLTQQQIQFLSTVAAPVLPSLLRVQGMQGAMETIAAAAMPSIEYQMLVNLAVGLRKAIAAPQTVKMTINDADGNPLPLNLKIPSEIRENIKQVDAQLAAIQKQNFDLANEVIKMNNLVNAMLPNLASAKIH